MRCTKETTLEMPGEVTRASLTSEGPVGRASEHPLASAIMRCAKRRGVGGGGEFSADHRQGRLRRGGGAQDRAGLMLRDRNIDVGEMPAQAWSVGAGHFSGNYAAPQLE